ncbi:AAA family ATPase [Blastococcus sp. TF02A-26]|uniref:AAA family ATPase n=1 Tax=Blastococcus sp. TF02A-26 TaxID=2250577 RepID=UPI000DEA1981|nr:AAA family ATPase [Blastococcus sp. TF02A-26]RBY87452.1 hypothetical protein DQ240_07655 [Blastococcus sp. TF02A-26]
MATRSSKLTGSAASVFKYLKDDEKVLGYYDVAEGFNDVWGDLAQELGLESGITKEQWSELFDGRWNGEKLVSSGYRQVRDSETKEIIGRELGVRTPMIDVVFAVPKGISELYARAHSEAEAKAIADAVLAAAKVAWTEGVESHARVARVPAGRNPVTGKPASERVTAKLLCTPALQFTARPTQDTIDRGSPADPHLHVHCATFTACQAHGRWLTADEAGIKRSAVFRDAIFMGEVSRNIENLGYKLDYSDLHSSRSGRISFEPQASDPKLRKFWSTNHERTYSIVRDFEEKWHRPPTDAELNQIMSVTRGRKADKEMDSRPVRQRWLDSARAQGLDAGLVPPGTFERADYDDRAVELWDRLMSAKGLCIKDATFSGDTIAIAIARNAIGLGFTREELRRYEAELREALVVVRPAADDRHQLYTTHVQLDREHFITARRREKARQGLPRVPEALVRRALARQPVRLDAEQQRGVAAACGASGWVHIEGYAGSGKTTLLAAARDAHRLAGTADRFIVASTAAATAERTGRKLEADDWGSVESLAGRIDAGRLTVTARTVWFVDEAAMMDTARMAELLRIAGSGRVVLVGDAKQLSPIGPAGWYGESVAEHGSVLLTRVHRHRDAADIRDYELLRVGKAPEAVANLDERQRIHIDEDRSARLQRVMRDYTNMRDLGSYTAEQIRQVIETSNHDVDTMNRFIQRDRLTRRELAGQGFEVEDVEQGRRWLIHRGDQVIFLRTYQGDDAPIRNGTAGTVVGLDPATGRAQIALGDRLATVWLQASEHRQPVGLAYAQHANKLQGGEVEMVQVMPGGIATANANSGYSQLTRARHEAHVYLDRDTLGDEPFDALARAWSVPYEKRSATWHQRHEPTEPARKPFDRDVAATAADERADWIAEHYGEDLARVISQSPAYPGLVATLQELKDQGNDATAMLAEAIEDRELRSAKDPAAVISWRLDQVPERDVEAELPVVAPARPSTDIAPEPARPSRFTIRRSTEQEIDRGISY